MFISIGVEGGWDMTDTAFNVLLYVDGSKQSFSAAVYTATLLQQIPTMHLTVVQVQDSRVGALGSDSNWMDTWPVNPNSAWMKRMIDEADNESKKQYQEISSKTNEIFSQRGLSVQHEILLANTNIKDTVGAIIDYALNNSIKLIIMGTRGLSDFQGLIFGSFAHVMLGKSPIPVMLIKKLPQSFIDSLKLDSH